MSKTYFNQQIIIVNSNKKNIAKYKYKIKLFNVTKLILPVGIALGIFLNTFCILLKLLGVSI